MQYYTDINLYTCQWLDNLIDAEELPIGFVECIDIKELFIRDLSGFSQVHFFSGIGGWPLALKLAGIHQEFPVWSGSCPCQPFSIAGVQNGTEESRHLWPSFKTIIKNHLPPFILGEQVAGESGVIWLDGVVSDLEQLGYGVRAATIQAKVFGARHERDRIFWLAHTRGERLQRLVTEWKSVLCQPTTPSTKFSNQSLYRRLQQQPDPIFTRMVDGLSRPVDIVRAFGNAIVPSVAAEFIKCALLDLFQQEN